MMIEQKKPKKKFFKTYLKERKQVGAFAPSSKFLVKKMCDKIDFDKARVIVELGPGTGVFTKEILKRAHHDAKIFVFELNEDFYKFLLEKYPDPRVILLHESADQVKEILSQHNINEADAVLSSLPLAIIPDTVKHKILDSAHEVLNEKGVFVQYQYSLNAKKLIEKRFGKLKIGFVPLNFPPAFIYCGYK
jgi:phospholipid N-methyltransferase